MTTWCSSWARRVLAPCDHDRARYAVIWWTPRWCLTAHQRAVLAVLLLDYRLTFADAPPLRLLHGLPGNFFVGFRPDSPAGWASHDLAAVSEGTVAGGHTHVAMSRWIPRSGDARRRAGLAGGQQRVGGRTL